MKLFHKILIFIICILIALNSIILYTSYQIYKNAINETSIYSKISKIKENENYIELKNLPIYYKNAVVSVEDKRFYNHGPIDLLAIGRAIYINIKNFDFIEGGSTITQQLAKNLYFISSKENTLIRKLAETIMAYDLENRYKKDEILELYINTIYFGDGYYGIQAACKGYLNKAAKDMNLFEATMMAGIPNAPSVYAPTVNLNLTLNRQKKVISTMLENKYISQEQADNLISQQSKIKIK